MTATVCPICRGPNEPGYVACAACRDEFGGLEPGRTHDGYRVELCRIRHGEAWYLLHLYADRPRPPLTIHVLGARPVERICGGSEECA